MKPYNNLDNKTLPDTYWRVQLVCKKVQANSSLEPLQIQKIYPFGINKSDSYKFWQQQKQLKTMKMSEAWPETFNEECIHQFQSEPTHKIHWEQQKHWVQRYPPMEHLWNDYKDFPNQHKNSHKQCNEMGHPVVNMMKVNGNWDNNMIRISRWRGSHCRTNTSIRRNK